MLKLLREHKLADVLPPTSTLQRRPVVAFLEGDTVGFALEKLAAEGLLSALVLRQNAKALDDGDQHRAFKDLTVEQVLGFVDLGIIMQHLLRGLFENTVHYDASSLEQTAIGFCQTAVGDLIKDSMSEPTYHGSISSDTTFKCDYEASLLKVIRECFLGHATSSSARSARVPPKSIHCVSVYTASPPPVDPAIKPDAASQLLGIVSQSDVIRFLHKHEVQAPALFHKTVKDLGLVGYTPAEIPPSPSTTSSETSDYPGRVPGTGRVTLVPATVTALEAFRRMLMHRDTGVGVLRDDGTLRASLSATDLRYLAPGLFAALLMRVDEFLDKRPLLRAVQQEVAKDTEGVAAELPPSKRRRANVHIKGVLTCQATSTLSEVLNIMAAHGVHRVYVVDPDSKPLGAITSADVLRVAADHALPPPRADALRHGSPAPVPGLSVRRSSKLESVTSVQSDCVASACTSDQSDRGKLDSRRPSRDPPSAPCSEADTVQAGGSKSETPRKEAPS